METTTTSKKKSVKSRPANSPEARRQELIALAYDNAEKKLRDGTASSQLIVTLLKDDTAEARLSQEIMELNKELLKAKTEAIQSAKRVEELYANALSAMREYRGDEVDDEDV